LLPHRAFHGAEDFLFSGSTSRREGNVMSAYATKRTTRIASIMSAFDPSGH
jgi:hypothetical protein